MVLAARKVTPGSLNAFMISDHMNFSGGFADQEPADVEAINRAGFSILCRDRHFKVDDEEFDAVISVNGMTGDYVARLTPSPPIPRSSLFAKILRLFRL